jgi:hypothetical protein
MNNHKFKKGSRVYVRSWPRNQHAEVIGFAETKGMLPHYIVKTEGGACYQVSQLELSSSPIDLK